jgi:hypothetical protein
MHANFSISFPIFFFIFAEDEDDYDESPAPGGDKAELQSVLKTLSAKL